MFGTLRATAYLCSIRPMKATHSLVLVTMAILEMDQDTGGRIWGYALSKKSGVRSGVLYPILDRMMGEQWLEDHWEEHTEGMKRPPRRYYTLTDSGRVNLGGVIRRAESEQRFAGVRVAFA
jgi:PadR family transcriptional regulator, regulatory protein PadR